MNAKPGGGGTVKMVQLADIFSKPEMSLMASVMDLFRENEIQYQPESLYYDISKCIGEIYHSRKTEKRIYFFLVNIELIFTSDCFTTKLLIFNGIYLKNT